MENTVRSIVANGLCVSCGICGEVCPVSCISYELCSGLREPRLEEACVDCGRCLKVCPAKGVDYSGVDTSSWRDLVSGPNLLVCSAWSRDKDVFGNAVSGGVVTELVAQALESDRYDAAFLVGEAEVGRRSEARLFVAGDDLASTQKSKYLPVSQANTARWMINNPRSRAMVVGTPCALRGLLDIISQFSLNRENYLLIGLFCEKTMSESVLEYFADKAEGMPEVNSRHLKAKRVDFRQKKIAGYPGHVRVYMENGSKRDFDRSLRTDSKAYFQLERCLYCVDKLNMFADISLGDDYTDYCVNEGGACSVVVRTERGMGAWRETLPRLECRDSSIVDVYSSQHADSCKDNYRFGLLKEQATALAQPLNILPEEVEVPPDGSSAVRWRENLRQIELGRRYGENPSGVVRAIKRDKSFMQRVVHKLKRIAAL